MEHGAWSMEQRAEGGGKKWRVGIRKWTGIIVNNLMR